MKVSITVVTALSIACLAPPPAESSSTQRRDGARVERNVLRGDRSVRFQPSQPTADGEGPSAFPTGRTAIEASTGYDNLTNGFDPQGPEFESLTAASVVALRSFNDNRFLFEEVERIKDGLGPVYNAQSCRECHQNVVSGGASQVMELRSGHMQGGQFFSSPGGTLIQSRSTWPDLLEQVPDGDTVRTFRVSTNTLGSGYIEAIANSTLLAVRDAQPAEMRGTAVVVPVLEAGSAPRIGRFGWKSQHASLESFAADAYLNEMGITSPLFPEENTASGRDVGYGTGYDPVPEPEDTGVDSLAFANFMRATKAPPRGPITAEVAAGEAVFTQIGCGVCHTASLQTAAPDTPINGGSLTVHAALADRIIHPYSDFLLHDVGTGDGIPIQPTPAYAATVNQIRTAPLWGLRTRNRLMHDGLALTKVDAILRHGGQAAATTSRFRQLSDQQSRQLLAFLNSL